MTPVVKQGFIKRFQSELIYVGGWSITESNTQYVLTIKLTKLISLNLMIRTTKSCINNCKIDFVNIRTITEWSTTWYSASPPTPSNWQNTVVRIPWNSSIGLHACYLCVENTLVSLTKSRSFDAKTSDWQHIIVYGRLLILTVTRHWRRSAVPRCAPRRGGGTF